MHQRRSRPFNSVSNFFTLFYPSESSKQLSTFHLPPEGDENVLAKVQIPQPILVSLRRKHLLVHISSDLLTEFCIYIDMTYAERSVLTTYT